MKEIIKAICPKCGKEYTGAPVISRTDNKTLVCPDCGTIESLEILGVSKEEQEKILQTIRNCQRK